MKSIFVLDFGGTAAVIAARKLRGARVFSRIIGADEVSMDILDMQPSGIVITGTDEFGAESWKRIPDGLLTSGIPVLAVGNAAGVLLKRFGGDMREGVLYREAALAEFQECTLFEGIPMSERFFSDGRALDLGSEWKAIGALKNGMVAAFQHEKWPLYGMQFDIEATDPDGWGMLNNFATKVCGCEPDWRMETFCMHKVQELSKCEGDAVIAISGGIDSAVCAELMRRAVGDRLHCVFVNTGLLRKGEMEDVRDMFTNQLHIKLTVVDAQDRILQALRGLSAAQEKRATIRRVLYDILVEEAERIGSIDNLVQGTVYTDLISSRRSHGASSNRIGDGAADAKKQFANCIEPLDALFKEEVRHLGEVLKLPAELVNRQPFPSLGLAQRIEGVVTVEKVNILREADNILKEEVSSAGLDKKLYQYFCVLTDLKTPGIKAGKPIMQHMLAIRAVSSKDAMSASAARMPYDVLERLVQRLVELPYVNRVVYDITPTPVAAVEWL